LTDWFLVIFSSVTTVAICWITFQFNKREISAKLKAEFDQKSKKEKEDRIFKEIIKWANPIYKAVQDLDARLGNILNDRGYTVLNENYTGKNNPDWSITYDFFMSSTLYLFAQYFALVQMLENELNFELLQASDMQDDFFKSICKVGRALGEFPNNNLIGCKGKDKQVFKMQQRAIGELLILQSINEPRCFMNYADFLNLKDDKNFQNHLKPLKDLLENLAPGNCGWKRLECMKKELSILKKQCIYLFSTNNENLSNGNDNGDLLNGNDNGKLLNGNEKNRLTYDCPDY